VGLAPVSGRTLREEPLRVNQGRAVGHQAAEIPPSLRPLLAPWADHQFQPGDCWPPCFDFSRNHSGGEALRVLGGEAEFGAPGWRLLFARAQHSHRPCVIG